MGPSSSSLRRKQEVIEQLVKWFTAVNVLVVLFVVVLAVMVWRG